jgi:hypothetical protein
VCAREGRVPYRPPGHKHIVMTDGTRILTIPRHNRVERNHQGIENGVVAPQDGLGRRTGLVECRERFGG